MIVRLIDKVTDTEVFVGQTMLGVRILAIDYVHRRVLLRGWNNYREMEECVLNVISYRFLSS